MGSSLQHRDEDSEVRIDIELLAKKNKLKNYVNFMLTEIMRTTDIFDYKKRLENLRNIIDGEIHSIDIKHLESNGSYKDFLNRQDKNG